jgi:type II secretory pathway component GspD/PulD (secretin)
MKETNRLLFAALAFALFVAAGCDQQHSDPKSAVRIAGVRTLSSFDPPTPGEKVTPAQAIQFKEAELEQVLRLYAEISGRSVIRSGNLPDVKITFSNQTPMTAVEVLQALDTVLAAQGITTVYLGSQYVKVVPVREAPMEPAPVVELRPDQLPDSSSFLIYIVKVKNVKPTDAQPALQAFAKMPNSILAINSANWSRTSSGTGLPMLPAKLGAKDHSFLILRDYSSNVRRMLQLLEKLEER